MSSLAAPLRAIHAAGGHMDSLKRITAAAVTAIHAARLRGEATPLQHAKAHFNYAHACQGTCSEPFERQLHITCLLVGVPFPGPPLSELDCPDSEQFRSTAATEFVNTLLAQYLFCNGDLTGALTACDAGGDNEHTKTLRAELDKVMTGGGVSGGVAPHEVLGVSADASPHVVRRAYHIAARRWHPDYVVTHENEAQKQQRKRRFMEVGEAFSQMRAADES